MLPEEDKDLFYKLALTFIPDVGSKTARVLLARYETAEAIFRAPVKELCTVDGVGEFKARKFSGHDAFGKAEEELKEIGKHGVRVLSLNSPEYPRRFLECDDAPVLLYYKGNANLNAQKVVAVIGTRKNTDYGQRACEDLIAGLEGMGTCSLSAVLPWELIRSLTSQA